MAVGPEVGRAARVAEVNDRARKLPAVDVVLDLGVETVEATGGEARALLRGQNRGGSKREEERGGQGQAHRRRQGACGAQVMVSVPLPPPVAPPTRMNRDSPAATGKVIVEVPLAQPAVPSSHATSAPAGGHAVA